MKHSLLSFLVATGVGVSSASWGADVEVRLQAGALSFSGGSGFTNAHLMITGPNDFEAEETASRGLPTFRVRGGRMKDGFYQFTLSAATDEKVKIKRPIDNGRGDSGRDHTFKPFHLSGMFEISRGTIVPLEDTKDGADVDGSE